MPDDRTLIFVKVCRYQPCTLELLKPTPAGLNGLGGVHKLTAQEITMRYAPFALGVSAVSTRQAVEAGVTGGTCIACYKSIAPELPKDDKDPNQ
jgi:hypothetical protein